MIISDSIKNPYEAMLQAYNPRRRYNDEMNSIASKIEPPSSFNLLDEIMKEAGIGKYVDMKL
jgi:hypothetical protein